MKISKTLLVDVTVEDIARVFAEGNSEDQAAFFAAVEKIMARWTEPAARTMQLHYLANQLDDEGKRWVLDLAEHLR